MQARRQPGSSFKPLVYAARSTTATSRPPSCSTRRSRSTRARASEWRPKNYDEDPPLGPSTLRLGIEKSRNQMTVRLAQDMGMPLIVEYSKRFGVYDDLLPVLAMSLGAGETTLLRMVPAYAMLANGGKQVQPTLSTASRTATGAPSGATTSASASSCAARRMEGQSEPELGDDRQQIIDPLTAYQMTSMMEGVVQRGTATGSRSSNVPIAGKTGTTNDEKDAWFVGYHARPRGRRLRRLRHAEADGQGHDRRQPRGADLRATS